MKYVICAIVALGLGVGTASAQMASHAPTLHVPKSAAPQQDPYLALKPAARVNGAVITELEVRREMITIFPYAQQHNGEVPKSMEPQIRKGALQMVIFEELLYQEAKRRNLPIAAEKLASAEKRFRQQFSPQQYNAYLKTECNNSAAVLHEKIRRSLLIESMMKTEVEQRSRVTVADAKAYYDQHAKEFEHGETASFQTISMIPPEGATKAMQQEAFDKIKDALRLAREAKNYNEFGILAEQISDDDWRTMMGDRKTMDLTKMPPEVASAIRATKVGQVSDIIKVDRAYVIVRVNAHTPAGRTSFADVKDKLQQELQAQRTQQVRSALNTKLTQTARIELL